MAADKNGEVVQGATALNRARILSGALSEAARRARFSTRSRSRFTGGGFQARRGAVLWRRALLASFVLVVALPALGAILYFGILASNQYVVEARFTVAGGSPPQLDGLGALTGIPSASIVQDTQIVTNYIQSRAAIEELDRTVNLRALYSRPEADFLARFNPADSIEDFIKYWKKMVSVGIQMPSGIVELRVRAFSPEDSVRIGNAILKISERLINEINGRMYRDAVSNASQQLERSMARLTHARLALERARNEGGMLDVNNAAEALNTLITDTRSALLLLQQEYVTQGKTIEQNAPQMRALKLRIDTTRAQVAELEAKLAGAAKLVSREPTLAVSMTKFSELDLEKQISERLYAAAATTLETARLMAEQKMMYINAFVRPAPPEESQYPRRVLFSVFVVAGTLLIWSICCGAAVLVRNHMA